MTVYAIAQGLVLDRDAFNRYLQHSGPTLAAHGGRVLAVDEEPEAVEGELDYPRTVIVEFASAEAFRRWYDSPAYQAARAIRAPAARGRFLLVQGLPVRTPAGE